MTRYLLDTNIVSNAVKPVPPQALLACLGEQNDDDLFIASFTVAEIRRGVLQKPPPDRKRAELEAWFSGPEGPLALFAVAAFRLIRTQRSFGRGCCEESGRRSPAQWDRHDRCCDRSSRSLHHNDR